MSIFKSFAGIGLLFATGCSSMLYYPSREQLSDPAKLALTPQDVWFPSTDGTKLHGWYFKAKERVSPKATIVFFHGNAQNVTTHFYSLAWILDQGYDYFIFDYRGYGKSEGEPSPKGTVQDGIAALRWTQARAQGGPVIVFAQSLGGAVAMRSVYETREDFHPRLVVVESTFHSYQAEARSVLSKVWFLWPFQWLAWIVISDKWAPEDQIEKISPTPLVVMHGTDDPTVAFKLGKKVFELARDPKEFWEVPGGRHTNSFFRPEGQEFRKRFLRKLDEVLSERQVAGADR